MNLKIYKQNLTKSLEFQSLIAVHLLGLVFIQAVDNQWSQVGVNIPSFNQVNATIAILQLQTYFWPSMACNSGILH